MKKEVSLDERFVKEIRKIQYIERITRTPILSKYRVDEYDRYLADEGHHINHLSKEAFEYYYNVYEPYQRAFEKRLKEIMTSSGNLDIDTPFGGGANKKGI